MMISMSGLQCEALWPTKKPEKPKRTAKAKAPAKTPRKPRKAA